MTLNEMIDKFKIDVVIRDGKEGIRVWGKPTKKQAEELKAAKPEIIAELKRRTAEVEAKRKAEEEKRQQVVKDIKSGKTKIKVSYTDGEYLQGWEVFGEEGKLLEEIGVAEYVSGWGYYIENKAIEKLGEEFTYAQAVEYMKPQHEAEKAEMEKKAAERDAKFQQAKKTGKPVELYKYTTDCDGSVEECSMDIVVEYAMPDGSISSKRTHTF